MKMFKKYMIFITLYLLSPLLPQHATRLLLMILNVLIVLTTVPWCRNSFRFPSMEQRNRKRYAQASKITRKFGI